MPKGNPNPSPETRFKPGDSGNPVGKSSEQRRLEIANAERATRIRARMLEALEAELDRLDREDEGEAKTAATAAIKADILKLLKDTEDRGLGTPLQSVKHTGDGEAPVHLVQHVVIDPPKRE
jgi:hypothetical protein